VDQRLSAAGVTANQVQAIWMFQVIVAPFRPFRPMRGGCNRSWQTRYAWLMSGSPI